MDVALDRVGQHVAERGEVVLQPEAGQRAQRSDTNAGALIRIDHASEQRFGARRAGCAEQ